MSSNATTNPTAIREWATTHSMLPVEVTAEKHDSEPPQLAFALASEIRGALRLLPWEQFFAQFSVQDLALVYDAGERNQPGTDFYEIVNNRPKSSLGYPLAQA